MAVTIRVSGAWVVQSRAPWLHQGVESRSSRGVAGVLCPHRVVERASSPAPLFMAVRNRGLEVRRETATPTGEKEGFPVPGRPVDDVFDQTRVRLAYPGSSPDKDCRRCPSKTPILSRGRHDAVLQGRSRRKIGWGLPVRSLRPDGAGGKLLEYEVKPSTHETKPQWLVEHYQGKMPALRHRKECYVESSVIADYLDFFFPNPPLKLASSTDVDAAEEATAGLFPALAKYLKHTPDGDDDDLELRDGLEQALSRLETHLTQEGRSGPFVVGSGDQMSLLDCSLAPKLYHMKCGLEAFKRNSIEMSSKFPAVQAYMDVMFARDSFAKSTYPSETVVWGWTNARGASR